MSTSRSFTVLVLLTVLLALGILVAGALAPTARGATTGSGERLWSFWQDSPTHALDAITDVARGPSGTMYATVDWGDDWADGSDVALYRIRPGDTSLDHVVWMGTWDNSDYHAADYPIGLAVDPSGNALVAGQTDQGSAGFDWLVVKWLRDSTRAWDVTYGGAGGGDDWLTDVAVDDRGNVYVCGSVDKGAGDRDWLVVKYRASDGKKLWEYPYSGPKTSTGVDCANAIAVDGRRNVYVAGVSDSLSHQQDVIVMKLMPDGSRDWIDRWNGTADKADYAEQIALHGGSVYVAGETQPAGAGTSVFAARYGAGGRRAWLKTWRSAAGTIQQLKDFVVDDAGHAIVAGRVLLGTPESKGYLASWNADGRLRWTRTYWNKATGASASFNAIAVDGRGRIWAGGSIVGATANQDALIVRFTSDARRVWQASIGGIDLLDDWYNDISLWGTDSLFAGGSLTTGAGDADALGSKYVR